MFTDEMIQRIKKHEDFSPIPYTCPAGKLTIGYGTNLEEGISKEVGELLLNHTIQSMTLEIAKQFPTILTLDEPRQYVLIDMAYNMGVPRLMKFVKTLTFIKYSKFEQASKEMLDSKWHRDFVAYDMQDGKKFDGLLRSEYLSKIMKEGKY